MGVLTVPTFDEFFSAVNDGREPFPWQSRLAQQVVDCGWPEEIGIPTGLGKTSCLDIAIWSLACQADVPATERRLPTRIWYVVNRRLIVDAAYEHGCRLVELLSDTGADGPIRAVAEALRKIRGMFCGESDEPISATKLRGGAELGARPPHPAQPTMIFSTVPMFASTWLFRGYASSSNMRSIDAAHAGIDSLVLIDEAHLSRPLRNLASPLAQCDIGDPSSVLRPERSRPQIVALTATGDAANPFRLSRQDLDHDIVSKRQEATKPTELVGLTKKSSSLPENLVKVLKRKLSDTPVAAVVFVNSPASGRAVVDEIRADAKKRDSPLAQSKVVLLTGRMRRPEADRARQAVLDPVHGAPADRDRSIPRDSHLIVVATQTLEVGADLDFDVLVTESCGARALIQRFGRLNRLGEIPSASAAIVHREFESEWHLYGTEPADVWKRLGAAAVDGIVNLAPSIIADVVGEPSDHPKRVAELLPAHLWEYAKTTTPPPGEAPVHLFYEGFDTDGPHITFCWRTTRFEKGEELVPGLYMDESIAIPIGEARDALKNRFNGNAQVSRLDSERKTIETVSAKDIRPNDTIVLHTSDGFYDEFGWSPDSTTEVLDLSVGRWPGLPLDADTIRHWAGADELLDDLDVLIGHLYSDDEDLDLDAIARQIYNEASKISPRPEVAEDWIALLESVKAQTPRIEWVDDSHAILARHLDQKARRTSMRIALDVFDDLCAEATSVRLDDHLRTVGEIASELARAIGLRADLVEVVGAAGSFHDLGKSDPRFQRWLDPEAISTDLLAKSALPRTLWRSRRDASGWPKEGRHEVLSARLVSRWLEEQDGTSVDGELLLHLIQSHHGYGRPLVMPADDPAPTRCSSEIAGDQVEVSGNLSEIDWDQPARFRRCCERYGYWGLALLESIVRQADHIASSASEVA